VSYKLYGVTSIGFVGGDQSLSRHRLKSHRAHCSLLELAIQHCEYPEFGSAWAGRALDEMQYQQFLQGRCVKIVIPGPVN
jgi:hypothetical protein